MVIFFIVIVVGFIVPVIVAGVQQRRKVARIWISAVTFVTIVLTTIGLFFEPTMNGEKVIAFIVGKDVNINEIYAKESNKKVLETAEQNYAVLLGNDISVINDFEQIKPLNCITDSYLIAKSGTRYTGNLMMDGKLDTSWQDGDEKGDAIGEKITFNFDKKVDITYMVISNGNCKSAEKYTQNSRIKGMTIHTNNDKKAYIELNDVCEPQIILLSDYKKVRSVSFVIESEYKGTKYKDTCISEVNFY